jgi:alpha-tubulin suppressor-like RCC1 family protein
MPSPGGQFLSDEFGDIEDYFVSDYTIIDQYIGDQLWVWGTAYNGRIGNNTHSVGTFTPITTFAGGTNWKQVSGGTEYGGGIKTDGTLWMWGKYANGRLGVSAISGSPDGILTPVTTFAGGTNWKQVSCGGNNTMAIKTDGTLWVWGENSFGATLGNNASGTSTPVTTFAGGNNWKSIVTNGSHAAAIKTDGTLWVWGTYNFGALGDNQSTTLKPTPITTFAGGTNWKEVAIGTYSMTAIKTDGTLWTWGLNKDGEFPGSFAGQLGTNDNTNRSTPVTTFAGGTNWRTLIGANHAIKTDGTLWVWGRNTSAVLGINNAAHKSTPVTTFAGGTNWKSGNRGANTIGAIKTDGTLWVWGSEGQGQALGIAQSGNRSTPVTTFAGGNNWKQVNVGNDFMLAIQSIDYI